MTRVALLQKMFEHVAWADAEISRALTAPGAPAEALTEYAHIAGVGEVWLSRIEGRPSQAKIWPALDASASTTLAAETARGYERLLATTTEETLDRPISYVNSAGQAFTTPLVDILMHVALHAQYHRGKVNVLLRQNGRDPAPTDFITFVRGVPAAVTPR